MQHFPLPFFLFFSSSFYRFVPRLPIRSLFFYSLFLNSFPIHPYIFSFLLFYSRSCNSFSFTLFTSLTLPSLRPPLSLSSFFLLRFPHLCPFLSFKKSFSHTFVYSLLPLLFHLILLPHFRYLSPPLLFPLYPNSQNAMTSATPNPRLR